MSETPRQYGPSPRAQLRLDPDFVAAIHAHEDGAVALTHVGTFAARPQLSHFLNNPVKVTNTNIERLRRIATYIGWQGPLFVAAEADRG